MHHWAALIFVGAIALHMARIFFTGAFRRPREINWVVGVLLLILALAAGFTGYSLPDDLLSGTGLRITYAIILAIPLIGERLVYLIFGGDWPGTDIIGRLYPVHILLIPAFIVGLLAVHLMLVWRQKHTQFTAARGDRAQRDRRAHLADVRHEVRSGLMFLVAGVIAAMGALFEVNAVWLYGPYDIGAATSFSQPDWYIGFLEGSLRLFPPWETRAFGYMINNIVYSGVLIPGAIFSGLLLVPWIEKFFTRRRPKADKQREHHLLDRPRDAPHRTAAGAAAISFVAVLFLGGAQDVIAGTLSISIGHVTAFLQIATIVVAADRVLRRLPPVPGACGGGRARSGRSGPAWWCATPAVATTASARPPTTATATGRRRRSTTSRT